MRAMHPQAERMPSGVTELAADYSGPVDIFTATDALEMVFGDHRETTCDKAARSACRHVAPALLLC
jgi:hypothetical protein